MYLVPFFISGTIVDVADDFLYFSRLPYGSHPAILLALSGHNTLPSAVLTIVQNGFHARHRLSPEQRHLLLQEKRDGSSHKDSITLKDANVPQARRLVDGKVTGEQRYEKVGQIVVGVVIRQPGNVRMELWRLAR